MRFETAMDFFNYSDKALGQVIEQAPGKPFFEQTKDGQKEIGKIVSAKREGDTTVVKFVVETDTPMDRLYVKLQKIVGVKMSRMGDIKMTNPESIDIPTLEVEIVDATTILSVINSDDSIDEKVRAIMYVFKLTSSKSIFEAVEKFFEEVGVKIES